MTVAFDAELESAEWSTTPDPFDFTFTPSGTPRGIVIGIVNQATSDDLITGVTYGGVAMARTDTAADVTGEQGRAYLYFLGASIPTGAQTVSIDHTATSALKWAFGWSITAAADTEVGDFGQVAETSPPAVALDTGAAESLRFAITFSDSNTITGLVPLTDVSATDTAHSNDFGNQVAVACRQTSAAASGSFTIGYSAGSGTMVALAIQEVSGAVTADPYPYVGGGYYPTQG